MNLKNRMNKYPSPRGLNSCVSGMAIAGLLLVALPAQAYVGPGAGISVLGAVWGVIVAVVVVIGGLLFLPFKIMMRKRKLAKEAAENGENTDNRKAMNEIAETTDSNQNAANNSDDNKPA